MATVNSRNAALLISSAGATSWTRITKTHGLKLSVPTELSDSTGHGQRFKSNTPGLQDFKATITKWYDTATSLLENISANKTPYYFLIYYDYPNNSQDYYRGYGYFVQDEDNLDLGATIDQSYSLALADTDPAIVRGGVALF